METLELNIPSKNIIRSLLEVLNPYIGYLTKQELDLVEIILTNKFETIDIAVRAKIRQVSDLEKHNLNNYLKKLRDKKVLVFDGKIMRVNPRIIKMTSVKTLNLTFNEQ